VTEQQVLVEHAERLQSEDGVATEHARHRLVVGRVVGVVHVEQRTVPVDQALAVRDQLGARGPEPAQRDVPRDEGVGVGVAPELAAGDRDGLVEVLGLAERPRAGRHGVGVHVPDEAVGLVHEERIGQHRADAHTGHRARGGVRLEHRTGLDEAGRAVAHHLYGRQLHGEELLVLGDRVEVAPGEGGERLVLGDVVREHSTIDVVGRVDVRLHEPRVYGRTPGVELDGRPERADQIRVVADRHDVATAHREGAVCQHPVFGIHRDDVAVADEQIGLCALAAHRIAPSSAAARPASSSGVL